jgi:D-alanyl-D-alanine carboxypeptidase/D-alanyl-D-alanine-endopeptidase (penicillin-binding protein 4)
MRSLKAFPVRYILICTAILFLLSGCFGEREKKSITLRLPESALQPAAPFLGESGLPSDETGFILYDLESGSLIASHNRGKTFIPASTTKIITALAGLDTLGPDFTFSTFLAHSGFIRKGVLHGDLYLVGSGDPGLSASHLMSMIESMKEKGIREVRGSFIYDQSAFEVRSRIEKGMSHDRSYNTGFGPLSLDYNRIFAWWDLRDEDEKELYLTPGLPNLRVRQGNEKLEETMTFMPRKKENETIWVMTSEPRKKRGSARLPVKRPGLHTAGIFRILASHQGIELPSPREGLLPEKHTLIAEHRSRSLLEYTDTMLTYSSNIMAEMILLRTVSSYLGRGSTLTEGGLFLESFCKEKIRGIDWNSLHLVNGSGLTSANRVSPEQMLGLLIYASRSRYGEKSFFSLLPLSGWEWSLISRLNHPGEVFRIQAKTGTINYALALAGTLRGKSGKEYLFTIFVTDYAKRKAFEKSRDTRSLKQARTINAWISDRKKKMDRLLALWIESF